MGRGRGEEGRLSVAQGRRQRALQRRQQASSAGATGQGRVRTPALQQAAALPRVRPASLHAHLHAHLLVWDAYQNFLHGARPPWKVIQIGLDASGRSLNLAHCPPI